MALYSHGHRCPSIHALHRHSLGARTQSGVQEALRGRDALGHVAVRRGRHKSTFSAGRCHDVLRVDEQSELQNRQRYQQQHR